MAKTPEEIAAEEKAAEAAQAKADEEAEEFDEDRALATIKKQRANEKKLKADLREARKAQTELAKIKQEQEDADKTATEKLGDRDARIVELENEISEGAVKADFQRAAAERGITDLGLAWLAAKEQGLLGKRDPKTGNVESHDFDKLEEAFPSLAGDGDGNESTGDAGVTGKRGKTGTVNAQFNSTVRRSITRR